MRIDILTVGIYAWSALVLAITIAAAAMSGRPPDHFARDPLAVMEGPFYIGMLSNLTMIVWFMAAGAAWLIASVMSIVPSHRRQSAALAAVAVVITLLGCDDLFMIHEEMLQRMMGVPEKVTVGAYGLLTVGVAYVFRNTLRTTPWRLVIPVAFCFAGSIGVDQLTTGFGWRPFMEDALKFFGVVGLLAYLVATGRAWLTPSHSTGRSPSYGERAASSTLSVA